MAATFSPGDLAMVATDTGCHRVLVVRNYGKGSDFWVTRFADAPPTSRTRVFWAGDLMPVPTGAFHAFMAKVLAPIPAQADQATGGVQ